jgi:ABC-type Fe3+ transport system permease subunit
VGSRGSGAAWASLVAGVASVLTLPVAIYATRYVESYDLIDAAYAIPVAAILGVAAIAFSRRSRRESSIRLGGASPGGLAGAGRLLGIAGVCIALAGVVSLAVYGLLEYAGNRG